jgi:hypothetical protein
MILQSTANMAAHHYALNLASWIHNNWLWIIAAIYFFILFYNIKRVGIDYKNQNLYASNYLKEIVIPFSQVKKITQGKLAHYPITIHLSDKTVFGDQILFVPLSSGGRFFGQNPIIHELEAQIGIEQTECGISPVLLDQPKR